MSSALSEQLEVFHSIIFPGAYNPDAEYLPGIGACRICGESIEHEDTDIYIATQKRVLALHASRINQ